MKSKLSILLGFFLFGALILSSCSKEEAIFSDVQNENTLTTKSSQINGQSLTTDELFDMFEKENRILAKIENFTDTKVGVTGTLYIVKNNGKTEKWIKADNEPISNKGLFPHKASVVMWTDGSVNCCGSGDPNCFGYVNKFIAWCND